MADKSGGRRLGRIIHVDVSKHLGVSGNTMLARRELDNGSTYQWRHHPAVVVILSGDAGLSGSDLWLCLAIGGPVVEPSEELAGEV